LYDLRRQAFGEIAAWAHAPDEIAVRLADSAASFSIFLYPGQMVCSCTNEATAGASSLRPSRIVHTDLVHSRNRRSIVSTTSPQAHHPSKLILFCVAAACSMLGVTPALARTPPPSGAEQAPSDGGWRTTIYPVYGWLPVFGAEVRLPEIPDPPPCDGCGEGGPIVPGGSVSSNLNGAAFAALLVENRWVQAEANFLWAGMSAVAERPNLKVKVDTVLGSARLGVRVVPNLFAYGGVRRIGLNLKATALVFDEVQWKPSVWEGLVGASFTPFLSSKWRLVTRADYGGLGADALSTFNANASIEWHPASHFALNLGYGMFKLDLDGMIRNRPIHLDQTLHGPIIGIGIPF
jgi:hypothetical protein